MVLGGNFFVEKVIPLSVVRELTSEEMAAYREPFPTFGSRLPTLVWPREIPFDGEPKEVAARIAPFSQWLPNSSMPKLVLYFEPGVLIPKARAQAMARDWTNLDAQFLGEGIHFVQEDHGAEIGAAIVAWRAAQFVDTPEEMEAGGDTAPD